MRTKGNKLHSSVEQVTAQDLHDVDVAVLSQYYEDKWSIFTQSLLTNHEKAELLAQNLAGSIFDEHIFEDIQAEIKYKLSKTIQST
jgi:deoxyadenosine/deoxycytidine kinase